MDCVWRLLTWGLVLVVVGVLVGMAYWRRHVDRQVRQHIESILGDHYQGLRVSVRSAQLILGEGVEIQHLLIEDPRLPPGQARLANFEHVFLHAEVGLPDLLAGRLDVRRIVFRRPELRLCRLADGSWSSARLLPLPKLGDHSPPILVEHGTLELVDPRPTAAGRMVLRDINLNLTPLPSPPQGAARRVRVVGSLAGDFLRHVDLDGAIDLEQSSWNVKGRVTGLRVSPELRGALPHLWCEKLEFLDAVRGEATIDFAADYQTDRPQQLAYDLSGRLTRGTVIDPRLPYPLSDVWCTFRSNGAGLSVRDLTARRGPASIRLNYRTTGCTPDSPAYLEARFQRFVMDRQVYEVLPAAWRTVWERFQPGGEINGSLRLEFDGRQWQPEAQVQCVDVSLCYADFPYRLEHLRGTLQYRDDTLQVNLVGDPALQIQGEVRTPGPDWTGQVTIQADHTVIEEKLLDALPAVPQKVVRSFAPHGTAHLRIRTWRAPGEPVPHKHLLCTLDNCALKYARFPYPLHNVRGQIEMLDQQWTFRQFEGTNDTGRIVLEGEIGPTPAGNELVVRFAGTEVPLEEELRDALNPAAQRLWNDLKPRGAFHVRGELRHLLSQQSVSLRFQAEPIADTASIEPRVFPYRMEKLRGTLVYQDGRVDLQNLRAEHNRVQLTASGTCLVEPDGRWSLSLNPLRVDRLRPEREFVAALPPVLRSAIARLRLDGQANLTGQVAFFSRPPDGRVGARWDMELDLLQGSLVAGVPLENINGGIRLIGSGDGLTYESAGLLHVDSLTYRGVQFTQLRGPVYFDQDWVLLGAPASRRMEGQPPQSLSAALCGGILTADGRVRLDQIPSYVVNARIEQPLDVGRVAREVFPGRQRISGKLTGFVNLHGTGNTRYAMGGNGHLMLRDANIYELPVMVSLLKLLSARPPDLTAFTTSDVIFRVDGGHVYFDRIDFKGDAISLLGQGWMNPDLEVGIRFRGIVGREELNVPILKEVLGGAGDQLLQLSVTGPISEPVLHREVLPAVNQALQQLQQELAAPPAAVPAARLPSSRVPPPAGPLR